MTAQIIKTEIDTDPLTRGYSGMTDQEIADDMNTEYRERNRTSMTSSEVYNMIDQTEWAGIVDPADKQEIWDILHLGDNLNPFGREADRFNAIFGGGSTTITDLVAARKESISRATELGLSFVKEGHVTEAKLLP
jgi:hypothetical protein